MDGFVKSIQWVVTVFFFKLNRVDSVRVYCVLSVMLWETFIAVC
jgi:hypothetical protein